MITKKEAKRDRERIKEILSYRDSRYIRDGNYNKFMYEQHKALGLDFENMDIDLELRYRMVFQYAWDIAYRLLKNANAAEIQDIEEHICDTLHELRIKKKNALLPHSVKAYDDAINIMKELKAKLPKRIMVI